MRLTTRARATRTPLTSAARLMLFEPLSSCPLLTPSPHHRHSTPHLVSAACLALFESLPPPSDATFPDLRAALQPSGLNQAGEAGDADGADGVDVAGGVGGGVEGLGDELTLVEKVPILVSVLVCAQLDSGDEADRAAAVRNLDHLYVMVKELGVGASMRKTVGNGNDSVVNMAADDADGGGGGGGGGGDGSADGSEAESVVEGIVPTPLCNKMIKAFGAVGAIKSVEKVLDLMELPGAEIGANFETYEFVTNAAVKNVRLEAKANAMPRLPPASASLPEVVFVGRSNVGKSSLVNMLCGRKAMASTSSTPGHTKHFFFYRSLTPLPPPPLSLSLRPAPYLLFSPSVHR